MRAARALLIVTLVWPWACAESPRPLSLAKTAKSPDGPVQAPLWMLNASLAGGIHGPDGPVKGATVTLSLRLAATSMRADRRVSGQKGRFEFPRLAPGAYRIQVRATGFAARQVWHWVDPGSNEVGPIRLEPSALVAGRVVDENGKEVPWAQVVLKPRHGTRGVALTIKTDNRGRFVAEGLNRGLFSVTVTAAGHAEAVISRLRAPARAVRLKVNRLFLLRGKVQGLVGIHARKPGADAGADPKRGAVVRLAGSGVWPGRTVAVTSDGSFQFDDLPAGIYEVAAWTRGEPWLASHVLEGISVGPKPPEPLLLQLRPAQRIEGKVVHKGEPVGDAVVALAEELLSVMRRRAISDGQGRFGLAPVVLGDYQLGVWAPGYLPVLGRKVALPATAPLLVELSRGATVGGRVVDAEGQPVAGVSIWVVYGGKGGPGDTAPSMRDVGELGVVPGPVPPIPPSGSWASPTPGAAGRRSSGVSDEAGRFTVSGLWPGRARLVVDTPGYTQARSPWLDLTESGELTLAKDLVLLAGGTVSGRVLDPRGRGVEGVRIALSSKQGDRTTFSQQDGQFSLGGLAGKVTLVADERGYLTHEAELSVTRGELLTHDIVLERAEGVLSGHVVDARRLPLAEVKLVARRGAHRVEGSSARSGFFELVGVGKKRVTLEARLPGYLPYSGRARPGVRDLELRLKPAASLAGRVQDQRTAAPLERFALTVRHSKGMFNEPPKHHSGGRFKADGLAPGPIKVTVRAEGYAGRSLRLTLSAPRTPGASGADPLSVDLVRAGELFGRVVDQRGNGLAAVKVEAAGVSALTDKLGRFTLKGVAEGAHRITATHEATITTSDPAVVRAGQPYGPVQLRISR